MVSILGRSRVIIYLNQPNISIRVNSGHVAPDGGVESPTSFSLSCVPLESFFIFAPSSLRLKSVFLTSQTHPFNYNTLSSCLFLSGDIKVLYKAAGNIEQEDNKAREGLHSVTRWKNIGFAEKFVWCTCETQGQNMTPSGEIRSTDPPDVCVFSKCD